jgi:hypothetical protein
MINHHRSCLGTEEDEACHIHYSGSSAILAFEVEEDMIGSMTKVKESNRVVVSIKVLVREHIQVTHIKRRILPSLFLIVFSSRISSLTLLFKSIDRVLTLTF